MNAEAAFRENQRLLWGIGYRMTGSAQDADDIVQETFARAVARPPAEGWRPWLVKIAVNLGRDRLRERKKTAYPGVWLPEAVPVEAPEEEVPDARYGMLESVTFAFLLALEALSPKQRAVLLLRDVLDYSAREAGEVLDMTEGDVRVTHHRARAAMEKYDVARCVPDDARRARTAAALQEFVRALAGGDAKAVESLLANDVRAHGDGGGKYAAARKPLEGVELVAKFFLGLVAKDPGTLRSVRVVTANALPALLIEMDPLHPSFSPRLLMAAHVDDAGRIVALHNQLVPEKLVRLAPAGIV